MNKKTRFRVMTMVLTIVMGYILIIEPTPIVALEDGAYVVTRSTSYENPETGQTADGGTNIALGNSMCASIIDTYALVEQVGGKTYVTLGIGLISNVSNVRIQVQTSANGGYQSVGLTYTGASTKDGDACYHYRFEVVSPDLYISPILYVEPMGRDVQFFVKLNMGSVTAGTGVFNAQMATSQTPVNNEPEVEATPIIETDIEEKEEIIVEPFDFEEAYKNAIGLTMYENAEKEEKKESNNNLMLPILAGIGGVSGIGYFVYIKKFRGVV